MATGPRLRHADVRQRNSVRTGYLYDAEGHRVAKGSLTLFTCDTNPDDTDRYNGFTPTAVYVLGPSGEQMTEMTNSAGTWRWAHTNVYAPGLSATYDADPTEQTEGQLYLALSDWLGTRRQQTDYAGNPCLTFSSLPYGDGLTPITISCLSPSEDATEHHYTGKERDQESGNDYFGARYYASTMGRFMSPDPLGPWVADARNPQSWNMYTYGLNNPMINTDPTGYDCVYFTDSGTGVESVDRNSNSGECGQNGGDWVNGTVQNATYFAGSDTWGFRSSDSSYNYLTYAYAPSSDPNASGAPCSGNCDQANGYSQTPQPGYIPLSSFVLDQFIRPVARQTGPVLHAGDCAAAGALAFSPVVTPEDAKDVSGALTDQGVDASEKGFEALSETKALSKGVRVGSEYLGKAAGVAGKGLAVHSAYENMKDAGCFGGGGH